ncbi:MAG TPA: NUDIX domain-containing protein [Ilumatobacteraceae bacterium]|nr:NUDIX domain-containing protein [Ilumatobacteraceae bacterium]
MRQSAGIVLHRSVGDAVEVLLGHMGGPFWDRKDAGAWTIPKGEYEPHEDPFEAACREFREEVGVAVPAGEFVDLGDLRQSGGKVVRAWAALLDDTTDFDPAMAVSNTFEMEWPPKSGRMETFPELDRVAWFGVEAARAKIIVAQREFLDRLSAGGI